MRTLNKVWLTHLKTEDCEDHYYIFDTKPSGADIRNAFEGEFEDEMTMDDVYHKIVTEIEIINI